MRQRIYIITNSTNKDFDKKTTVVVEVKTADKAVESLTAGKTYYVRVRAFKFNEDGTKVYGGYTEVQRIETSFGYSINVNESRQENYRTISSSLYEIMISYSKEMINCYKRNETYFKLFLEERDE